MSWFSKCYFMTIISKLAFDCICLYQRNNFLVENYCYDCVANYLIYRLCIQLKQSHYTMKKKIFCTKTQLLNLKITLSLPKLDIISSKLVSNGLIFSVDILVNIQLVHVLLLSNIGEISIGVKTRNFSTLIY